MHGGSESEDPGLLAPVEGNCNYSAADSSLRGEVVLGLCCKARIVDPCLVFLEAGYGEETGPLTLWVEQQG